MGFFSRLGSRISSGLKSAARVGKKSLGAVSRVGNAIAHGAEKVVNVVDRIPVVGQVLAPVSGVVRSGIGLVQDVADAAASGKELIEEGEKLLGGEGDAQALMKKAKTQLEKGKQIKQTGSQVMAQAKAVKSSANLRQMGKDAVNQFRNQ
tara:strand:- start:164 stop:613 length:450 start_codon:yes stop_codon:yes gene_type:complete